MSNPYPEGLAISKSNYPAAHKQINQCWPLIQGEKRDDKKKDLIRILQACWDNANQQEKHALFFALLERIFKRKDIEVMDWWICYAYQASVEQNMALLELKEDEYLDYFLIEEKHSDFVVCTRLNILFLGQIVQNKPGPTLKTYLAKRSKKMLSAWKRKEFPNQVRQKRPYLAIWMGKIAGSYDDHAEMKKLLKDRHWGQGRKADLIQNGYPRYASRDSKESKYVGGIFKLDEVFTELKPYKAAILNENKIPALKKIYEQPPRGLRHAVMAIIYWKVWLTVQPAGIDPFYLLYHKVDYRDNFLSELLNKLIRKKHEFNEFELLHFLRMIQEKILSCNHFHILHFFKNVEAFIKREEMTPKLSKALFELYDSGYLEDKAKSRLQKILLPNGDGEQQNIAPYVLSNQDEFGDRLNNYIPNLPTEDQEKWHRLLWECCKADSGKPSKALQKTLHDCVVAIGAESYEAFFLKFSGLLASLKVTELSVYERFWVHPNNVYVLKGLIWSLPMKLSDAMVESLEKVIQSAFKKIPGKGPAAPAVGNAGLYVLARNMQLNGVNVLSRLKRKVRQNNTQKLIGKYLDQAAQQLQISTGKLEEMAAEDFGMQDGQRTFEWESYQASLTVLGIGKTKVEWTDPNGKMLKSTPSIIKKQKPDLPKEISTLARAVKKELTAQRNRIDRLFIEGRSWEIKDFQQYYLDHGLISFIARKLIWEFQIDQHWQAGFLLEGKWVDASNKLLPTLEATTKVRLWHPASYSADSVQAWRSFLLAHQIQQPMKQAYREVYWLTDAERNTQSYSNRMAAHLLKQHQFAALAKLKGWNYQLIGAYDYGYSEFKASIPLPDYQLSAEFWIHEVHMDEATTDAGIHLYVATDQLRFVPNGRVGPVDLEQVPVLVFSEIMRDLDLFVGVASVGNDPNWQDSGGQISADYRQYWQAYSFGELSELAKTRHSILQNLIPRLKIAEQCQVTNKFLQVQGKLRTYKIHIGSGNILMEPNDQYLCIVPDATANLNSSEKVWLPFEGDRVLSIILSKAFMLAADDQIKDETISRQIKAG